MNKLSLKLDDLRVESFETLAGSALRGTVRGNEPFAYLDDSNASCPTCEPIDTCTCAENGCGGAEPVTVAEPNQVVRAPDTMYPGCTTVHTGCGETV